MGISFWGLRDVEGARLVTSDEGVRVADSAMRVASVGQDSQGRYVFEVRLEVDNDMSGNGLCTDRRRIQDDPRYPWTYAERCTGSRGDEIVSIGTHDPSLLVQLVASPNAFVDLGEIGAGSACTNEASYRLPFREWVEGCATFTPRP